MKLIPSSGTDLKLFITSLVLAVVLNAGTILEPGGPLDGAGYLIGWVINALITAVVIMVIIRVTMWAAKKMGMTK